MSEQDREPLCDDDRNDELDESPGTHPTTEDPDANDDPEAD
jgi:hypothetical protein